MPMFNMLIHSYQLTNCECGLVWSVEDDTAWTVFGSKKELDKEADEMEKAYANQVHRS